MHSGGGQTDRASMLDGEHIRRSVRADGVLGEVRVEADAPPPFVTTRSVRCLQSVAFTVLLAPPVRSVCSELRVWVDGDLCGEGRPVTGAQGL